MNKMCIVGYYEESTELTIEEQKEELELLTHYHIEDYGDGTGDVVRTGTQEEYDNLANAGNLEQGVLYVVRDD